MRAHYLPITYNRFTEDDEFDTTCILCQMQVAGDEPHYLFECSYFQLERNRCISNEIISISKIDKSLAIKKILGLKNDKVIEIARFVKAIINHFKKIRKQQPPRKQAKNLPFA